MRKIDRELRFFITSDPHTLTLLKGLLIMHINGKKVYGRRFYHSRVAPSSGSPLLDFSQPLQKAKMPKVVRLHSSGQSSLFCVPVAYYKRLIATQRDPLCNFYFCCRLEISVPPDLIDLGESGERLSSTGGFSGRVWVPSR